MTGMSVVRRKGGDATPPKSQTSQAVQAQNQVEDIDLNNIQWIDISSNVYKINPGDEIIFRPLSELREVRGGTAWVITAYVYIWKDASGKVLHQNETLDVYMQKVLAMRVKDATAQYGINNFVVYAKNLGRQGKAMYYNYQIKIGVING
jgi:hypothetical protein